MNPLEKATYAEPDSPIKAQYHKDNQDEEVWLNDIYQVSVRRNIDAGGDSSICHLSIKRLDKGHQMDWRHMQQIKNQLVGEEHEGMEMFPAESRLVDGANQFHMWVFENKELRYPWGFDNRLVTEDESIGNTQRPFEEKPEDMEECTERYLKGIKEMTDE